VPTAWWVNQGSAYAQQRRGGYVWAPTKTKAGHPVEHHVNVNRLQPGDAIIHYANGAIHAVGIVREKAGIQTRPTELPTEWGDEGYLARVEYNDLPAPIPLAEVPARTPDAGPFNRSGAVNQGYLYPLSATFARSLYDTFADRWPIAWMPTRRTTVTGWDEFIFWAKKLKEWPGFDDAERNYKLRLAQLLVAVRDLFRSGNDEWTEALRKAVTSKDNNFTNWRVHNPFLEWVEQAPDEARVALGHLWNSQPFVPEAIDAFTAAGPLAKAGKSSAITLASVLLTGIDVLSMPAYRKRSYFKGYDLTGYARPSGEATHGELYSHGLAFLDRILKEAASRGLVLRDRLDAQSVLWTISQGNEVEEWSDAEKARFQAFVNGTPPQPPEEDDDDLEILARELHLDVSYLRLIQQLLEHKRQVIFYGPPGTGKTYVAKKLAELFAANGGVVEKVQFHPSYAYEDFVEGYRPRLTNGQAGFALIQGPLRRIAEQARKTDATCVLLIDEINRGNVAKVFGELYYLLEYRDEQISLQYSEERASLPKNLWIIGTMNTADRSIALVDSALRRRFHFVPFYPDRPPIQGLLRRWLQSNKPEMLWVADVVDRANEELGSNHMAIGPSHFLRGDLTEEWMALIWEHSVLPYIAEQYFGDDARLEAFALAKLRGPRPGMASPPSE
jgi:5-methylcytosine-specific restriction protein B